MAETKNRNFLAQWKNWPEGLDKKAKVYRKKSFFKIDGANDNIFNNFRVALWHHRKNRCSILTGLIWYSNWTNTENGIIPKEKGTPQYGHAIKIFGQKTLGIGDEIYLMAQLSNGEDIGENGIFFFPKEVINRECKFGAYMFIDIDPQQAKKICWSLRRIMWERIKKILRLKFK